MAPFVLGESALNNVLELLAPARTADIGIEAIKHGADAVYIGGPLFSARANAGNSMSEIERLCSFAHRFNGRIYMALNTIFTDAELEEAAKLARQAYEAGVDALIVQDMGLLECNLPPIQLHASTQCDIRTPEKAKFLEDVGFSQIVPARELDLAQIKAIYDVLDKARIEFFIHGALCVSYSGQCYASQFLKGRSANRGDCAQICRLPFEIYTDEGELLRKNCHALSLKDNNQSGNIDALIRAGVRSFKIEGRYKDLAYVKNTSAFYRRLLDDWLEKHPEFVSESTGKIEISFDPDPNKTFNRGTTDYFVNGRGASDITSFDTPKNAGEPIGRVKDVNDQWILIDTKTELNNGDGLTFYDSNDELKGFMLNRAESAGSKGVKLFIKGNPMRLGLREGTEILRNKDVKWVKLMNANTALRKIPITISAGFKDDAFTLTASDGKVSVSETLCGLQDEAKNREKLTDQISKAVAKLGETDYTATNVNLDMDGAKFIPASLLNQLRRSLVEKLQAAESEERKALRPAEISLDAPYPVNELDYHGNVLNSKAKEFYERHGVNITESALETGRKPTGEVELMRCKHCIRYALDLCPKEAKKRGEKIRPTPLKLKYKDMELEARFHCKPCEMSIVGNVAVKSS